MAASLASDEKSIPTLIAQIVNDSATLIMKEIQLARIEIIAAGQDLGNSLVAVAVGGGVAFAGLIMLLIAAAIGLNLWLMQAWLSALIVGAVALAVGAGLVIGGRRSARQVALMPERTLHLLEGSDLGRRRVGT